MAAARIVLVYLQRNAPCVWVRDARTCERRELLHLYKAVCDRTAAINSLKGYLYQFAIRLGSLPLEKETTQASAPRQSDRSGGKSKRFRSKLGKLAAVLGKARRIEMSLPSNLQACVDHLCGCLTETAEASG